MNSSPPALSPQQPVGMPLFYNSVTLLDSARHGNLRMGAEREFSFARNTSAIPLVIGEFSSALAHYPIVFTSGAAVNTVAVLGVRPWQNLFVDAGGRWRTGCYQPAYLRRYPFILIDLPEGGDAALGIALENGADDFRHGDLLFADGKPTDAVRKALAFCLDYREEALDTADFINAVVEAGILTDQTTQISFSAGKIAWIKGFQIVDAARLHALPEATLLAWLRRGWLAPLYAHLFSLQRWADLASFATSQQAGETEPPDHRG